MKIFKHRNIFGLIYMVLLAIPFVSVIARVIYVQSNKNAYQSYYGETINSYENVQVTAFNQLEIGKEYSFVSSNSNTANQQYTKRLYFSNIKFVVEPINAETWVNNMLSAEALTTTYYEGHAYLVPIIEGTTQTSLDMSTKSCIFTFTLEGVSTPSGYSYSELWDNFIIYKVYNNFSFLDNVFEYSLDSIIHDNNFGNINFFSFFETMFLNDNQVNNRYVGYANWYMNYVMFVSCAYLLFLVLMWFINFARKVLERGMNYDW